MPAGFAAHRLFALVGPVGQLLAQLRRDDRVQAVQKGHVLAGGGNVVTADVQHQVELILHIVPLHGGHAHLHRHLLAAVVLGEHIILLDPQGADGVAVDRQQVVDEIVLDAAGLVPGGIAVLVGLGGNAGLDLQHTAGAVPGMGQAVHDDHALRPDGAHGGVHSLLVVGRRVRRGELDVIKGPDAQIRTVGVQLAALVLSINEADLLEIPAGHAGGQQQSAQGLAAAGHAGQCNAELGFFTGGNSYFYHVNSPFPCARRGRRMPPCGRSRARW